jgi:hypothetical protein
MTDNNITENKAKAQVNHANIYVALASAQIEMGPAYKSAVNPHYNTKYADLFGVMQAALPALNNHGICAWSSIVPQDDGKQAMRTTLSHGASDTHMFCDVPLLVAKNDMQGMKSATTYAKRIGIESLTGIAPEDDDGNDAAKAPPKAQQAPKEPDAGAVAEATTMLFGADDLDDLKRIWTNVPKDVQASQAVINAKDARKAEIALLSKVAAADEGEQQ